MKRHRGKFRSEYVRIAEDVRERYPDVVGMTYVRDLARLLGVSSKTVWQWTLEHPDFRDVVDEGFAADPVDGVEASLFRLAEGYSCNAERIDVVKMTDREIGSDGRVVAVTERIEVVRTPYIEHVPPNQKSIEFILRNLRNERWRDRHEVRHVGHDGGAIEHRHAGAVDRLIAALADKRAKMIDVTPEKMDADQGQLQQEDASAP